MDKELRNREYRLRKLAKKKGLYLKKGKWYQYWDSHNYTSYTGYSVGNLYTGFLIIGYNQWNQHLLTLEEAEEFIQNY